MKFLHFFESFNKPEKSSDLEDELNIIDTINRSEIKGDVPKDAQYAALNPSGEFIQKFYKFKYTNINDGTIYKAFMYWGEQGGWYASEFNKNGVDYNKLDTQKFLKIID